MNKEEIEQIIPHRDPFLYIDKIVEIDVGKHAIGIKKIVADEWYFQGHFPDNPIMPGVLIIEALAQVGAVAILSVPENKGKIVLFAGMEKVRFKRIVKPGDELNLDVELTNLRGRFGKSFAQAKVEDQVVAEAELMFMVSE